LVVGQEINHIPWLEHVLALHITQATSLLLDIGEFNEVIKDFLLKTLTHPLSIASIIMNFHMHFFLYLSYQFMHPHKNTPNT
jgi:hypothetical protein